jgi:hypothetical protein
MTQAFKETVLYFIKWRLLSLKFWLVVLAGYEYHYAVSHNWDAAKLAVTGVSVLGALANHVWGQQHESKGGQ